MIAVDELAVACPRCGADPGQDCVVTRGAAKGARAQCRHTSRFLAFRQTPQGAAEQRERMAERVAAARVTRRSNYDGLIGRALVEAEMHRVEDDGPGCICGFCVYSVEHVLVMSLRAAIGQG